MDKGTGRQGRLQAYEAIKRMERPDSITPTQWGGVRDLLWRIARRYPKAYPSQETLAREMSKSIATVERYVRLAREAGLLTVWYDAGTKKRGSYSRTNWYHITELLEVPPQNEGIEPPQNEGQRTGDTELSPVQQTPPSVEKTSSSPPTSGSARQRRGRTILRGVAISREEKERVEALLPEPKRIAKRPRSREIDPSRRLARYFLDQWESEVQEQPRLREFRPDDSVGQSIGYIRSRFISPAAGRRYTEDEVREYIDQFMEAVRRSLVQIKPKQSAFMRFVGWWGRTDKPADPDLNRKYQEEVLTRQQRAQ